MAFVAEPVIYGSDDRVEPHQLSHVAWIAGATTRAVALFPATPPSSAEDAGNDEPPVDQSAGERLNLCPEERFADQPSIADCSGVLVSNDVVLVAGHCFEENDRCDRYLYALDYAEQPGDAGAAEPVLVRCRELVIREVGWLADGSRIDYALIQLERPVDVTAPDLSSREEAVEPEAQVTSLGFPVGLPLKVDPNGKVLTVDRTGFNLLTDAYHGSSGSGVYDQAGRLVGILTSGQADFYWDLNRDCKLSRVIAIADAGTAERGMHLWVALSRACFRKPELALCSSAGDAGAPDGGMMEDPPVVKDPVVNDPGRVPIGPPAKSADSGADQPQDAAIPAEQSGDSMRPDERTEPRSSGCSTGPSTDLPRSSFLFLGALLWLRRSRRQPFGALHPRHAR